tara:strand:- start:833 stop:2425 length:1593 start_codon:yes stop_codon:yes gene_type:complete
MKINNKHKISQQYIIEKQSVRGTRQINGNNFGDELTHNAFDANSSVQGLFIKPNEICYGNDGDFLDWDTYVNRVILSSIPGTQTNSTSYWGVGVSKKTWWIDGCPNYTLVRDFNKYYKRVWEYDIQISDNDFVRKNTLLAQGGCNVVEYEITKDEWEELVPIEELGFNPTLFVSLRRFEDSEMIYNPKKIIDSINTAMISYNGKMKSFCEMNGKRIKSRQLYYNQVKPIGDTFQPIWNFRELPKVRNRFNIGGGLFDIYLYSPLLEESDEFKKWDYLYKATDGGKDILKIDGRGVNPRQIWINKKGTTLTSYDVWKYISGKDRELTYNTNMIFHLVDGDFEFPEIKTDLPTEKILKEVGKIHLEEVQKNKVIQYNPKKKEDAKVDKCFKHLVNGDDIQYQQGITESILTITDDKLTRKQIRDEDNHEVRETQTDGRNYDWLIRDENGNFIFHAEFMNKSEDWEHIDQTTFKVLSGTSYYNILIVDRFADSNKKRNEFKKVLEKRKIETVLYMSTLNDFLNGNTNNFKKIK